MGLIDRLKRQPGAAEGSAEGADLEGERHEAAAPGAEPIDVAEDGTPCTATVRSIEPTGVMDISGKEYEIEVSVESGGDAYDVTVRQFLLAAVVPDFQPGATLEARVDPGDPGRVVLIGPVR